jgi:GTP 3',8-cyclase
MMRLGQFTPQLKLLFHTDKINRWLDGEDVYPILIEFDLSNKCNQKCNFCNSVKTHNDKIMDSEVVIDTITELAGLGVKAINWTGGGEPLLNRAFPQIAIWAKRQGIEQGIFTNGVVMYENWLAILVATQSWIRLSIDAGIKATYQAIRGTDEFDKIISIVKDMVALRDKYNFAAQIGIGFVITKDNYQEIEDFSKLIKDTGADYGQYKPSTEDGIFDKELWNNEVKPRLERVFKDNPKAVINLYKFNDIAESNLDQAYPVCYGHQFCPCIGADGEVWACPQLRGVEGYSFGNIYKNTFKDIWHSAQRQEVIKKLDVTKCPKLCKNNEINKILYRIKHPTKDLHYNFL